MKSVQKIIEEDFGGKAVNGFDEINGAKRIVYFKEGRGIYILEFRGKEGIMTSDLVAAVTYNTREGFVDITEDFREYHQHDEIMLHLRPRDFERRKVYVVEFMDDFLEALEKREDIGKDDYVGQLEIASMKRARESASRKPF